jgi:uncharacterized Zn-binding protein involved in type VI secretion|tara:strand:- start:882 stop:1190 length:309 start_codon:yes stop_codon:yes gene_type:complete
MPAVGRNTDACTGDPHSFPPTNSDGPVQDFVFVDELLANTVGHGWPKHYCTSPHDPKHLHDGRYTSGGSSLVYIEDKALARVGDPIDCGASLAQGSEITFSE